jgi:hypothetical protein
VEIARHRHAHGAETEKADVHADILTARVDDARERQSLLPRRGSCSLPAQGSLEKSA